MGCLLIIDHRFSIGSTNSSSHTREATGIAEWSPGPCYRTTVIQRRLPPDIFLKQYWSIHSQTVKERKDRCGCQPARVIRTCIRLRTWTCLILTCSYVI